MPNTSIVGQAYKNLSAGDRALLDGHRLDVEAEFRAVLLNEANEPTQMQRFITLSDLTRWKIIVRIPTEQPDKLISSFEIEEG